MEELWVLLMAALMVMALFAVASWLKGGPLDTSDLETLGRLVDSANFSH
jgi:hypothetical protein